MPRRSAEGDLVPNEKLVLIGGLDLKLSGKDQFWSAEILDVMDDLRSDGLRTGGGTLLRASATLINKELLVSDRPKVLKPKQRIYYSLTEEGLRLAPYFYLRRVVDASEDVQNVAKTLRRSLIGEFVLETLWHGQPEL